MFRLLKTAPIALLIALGVLLCTASSGQAQRRSMPMMMHGMSRPRPLMMPTTPAMGQRRMFPMPMGAMMSFRSPMMTTTLRNRTTPFFPRHPFFDHRPRFDRFEDRLLRASLLGQLSASAYGLSGLSGGAYGMYGGGGGGYGAGGASYVPAYSSPYRSPYGDDSSMSAALDEAEQLGYLRRVFDEYLFDDENAPGDPGDSRSPRRSR
jgi:hypothetical protein